MAEAKRQMGERGEAHTAFGAKEIRQAIAALSAEAAAAAEAKAAEEAAATMPDSAHGDAEHGASADMPIVTEEQQMHHLAIFDACAEVVRAPLPSMPASLSLRR